MGGRKGRGRDGGGGGGSEGGLAVFCTRVDTQQAIEHVSCILALVMVTSALSLTPRTLHLYVPNSS